MQLISQNLQGEKKEENLHKKKKHSIIVLSYVKFFKGVYQIGKWS